MIEKLKPLDNGALKRLAGRSKPGTWYTSVLEGVQSSVSAGRQDPGYFHPSHFGDPCDANLAFWYLGAPNQSVIGARLQRIFDLGHGRDAHLKRDTANAGVSLIKKESDRKISIPHLHIRGELDEWVVNPADKQKYVIDFKTMNSRYWTDLKEVKHDHHIQVMCYELGKQTYKGFVLYENKDDQNWKLMQADFDGKMWQTEVVDRVERIIKGLEQDTVYRNPVNCSQCPFFANGVCTNNDIAGLKAKSGLYV